MTAVWECKVAVSAGTETAIEEATAALEECRWMLWEDRIGGQVWLAGYFDSRPDAEAAWQHLTSMLDSHWLPGAPEFRSLPEADWRESYKAHFRPWRFGRLHWVPVWERGSYPLPPGEAAVWLDPGMAFGTGNHETTRLCCERLAAFAAQSGSLEFELDTEAADGPKRRNAQRRVVDAGCGSGILAISAAKLSLGPVVGFDNDAEAVRVSRENAALNGVTGQVEFFIGDLTAGLAGRQAELVLANIQADVLRRHRRQLVTAVAPDGWLVLSGILAAEVGEVKSEFSAAAVGWTCESRVLGEWADVLLKRNH